RVVHDHEVVFVGGQLFRVHHVVAAEDLDLVGRERARVTLQAVVQRLGDVEELLGALDDAPLDLESNVGHERHERVVDLGDTAAERGRREMDHALALQRLGEPMNLVDETARGDRRVVGEALVPDVDELEQSRGSLPWDAARQSTKRLTNRSREPPPFRRPISSSSASAWMMAMPRPPSESSSDSSGPPSPCSNPSPVSVTSITRRS